MSDLIKRAQKARISAADPSLPKWRRLLEAFNAFSGLELTDLTDQVRESLEADLVRVNQVLDEYIAPLTVLYPIGLDRAKNTRPPLSAGSA
jgi:hypothetical protein